MSVPSLTSHGVALSLMAACFWAVSPMCFASAGRRIGSLRVVVLRTVFAAGLLWLILPAYSWVADVKVVLPTMQQTFWLALSALTGMAVGDGLIYEALVIIGPRRSTQILTLSPVAALIPAWFWLDETLGWQTLLGVVLTLGGTSYAVLARRDPNSSEPGRVSAAGIAFAVGGALCVGLGAVAGRQAFLVGPLDAAVATAVRVSLAAVILAAVPLITGRLRYTLAGLRNAQAVSRLALGIAAGPVLGMLCYIFALKSLEAGLVSTLTAMSPLFILPMIAVRYRMHIGGRIAASSLIAAAGVALICMR